MQVLLSNEILIRGDSNDNVLVQYFPVLVFSVHFVSWLWEYNDFSDKGFSSLEYYFVLSLSRALKKKGNTPKYGLIFHSSFIGRAGAKNKGRVSRYLANKCSIASRIDCFSGTVVLILKANRSSSSNVLQLQYL